MKRLKLLFILLLSLTLTGCIQEYNMTDEESDSAAEYMAGLLLKYDKEYKQDLTPLNEITKEDTSVQPTASPEEEATKDNSSESVPNDTETATATKDSYTISEVIEAQDFDIEYKSYQLADTYPEDSDSAYFTLTPREGHQLLVAEFNLKNISNSKKNLNLSKEKIQYQLDINEGTIYKPLLTLLENDLQYINITVKKQETKTVLLVFEIPKDKDISAVNLIISKDDKSENIEIK